LYGALSVAVVAVLIMLSPLYTLFPAYMVVTSSRISCDTLLLPMYLYYTYMVAELSYVHCLKYMIAFAAKFIHEGGEVILCGEYSSHLLLWLLWYGLQ
jgi:hypothetical protein